MGVIKADEVWDVGHAFVGIEKHNTDNTVVRQVLGLYPTGSGLSPGKAKIKDNGGDRYTVSYTKTITANQFNNVKNAIIDDFNNANYVLSGKVAYDAISMGYNCADAALRWMNVANAQIQGAATQYFSNTPGDLGHAVSALSGANQNPGFAPLSTGPCIDE